MQAVLIDVDGTLVDSFPGVTESYLHALKATGGTHPEGVPLRRILGPPMVDSLTAAGASDVAAAQRAYLEAYGESGWSNYSVYPGAREFLAAQRARGRLLATATSKGAHFARKVLAHAGLLEFFDVVATAGTPGGQQFPTKADVVGEALRQLSAAGASEFVMLGDRVHDSSGAHAHGIPTIAATWGYGDSEEWSRADARAEDFSHAARIIDELFG
ncbi:hypothetical protein C1Y63_10110 [Corynebacterium sp. 13CS0277]|uniref:HAD hydrolase-like protein n=1 Tax=Corynebacterium sp. 13CS0277 TaxID=2071994 RepID=UPI000D027258|nr:HAD hydrolase-like protein [Corynebacterium sp. 13CS0277]PRQ10721.1 hypothetical protein C1Y63_10110 [Corynebacterium sp. 13CS0277]